MYVEEQIATLSKQDVDKPFAWLICYQDRPLQAAPAGGSGAHLLLFSSPDAAAAYISGRQAGVGIEPLSTLALPNAEVLKDLTILSSHDAHYTVPPCGLMLDADYAGGTARKVIPPGKVSRLSPLELARELGLASGPVSSYAPDAGKVSYSSSKKSTTVALIVAGALVVLCLCLLMALGGWWVSKNGGLAALGLGPSTPTYPAPIEGPYPTAAIPPTEAPLQPPSTATPVPLPTAVSSAWTVSVKDDFSANTNQWDIYTDNQDSMLKDSQSIGNGRLTWQLEALDDNVFAWNYPKNAPDVSDFDASIDAQRTTGSDGDFGIIFRLQDKNNFCSMTIDDLNQQFWVDCYESTDWVTIIHATRSSAILNGGVNRLGVSARGSYFVFTINDTQVGQANIAAIPAGQVGICADLYSTGDKMTLNYDNFELRGATP